MSSGRNPFCLSSESYSGRMSPALGLRRLTSAMTAMVGWRGCSVTAAKKSRGGGVSLSCDSRSASGVEAMSASTSSRLWAMISERTAGISGCVCSGWVMWLIIGAVLAGVAPEAAAQVVDSAQVQDQSVGDLLETMEKWKLATLLVSLLLVIALLFAGGLLRPGGYAKAGLRDVGSLPSVVWIFAIFVVFLAMSAAPQLVMKIQWIQDQEYDETQMEAINVVATYLFGMIAGMGMLFVLKKSTIVEGECKSGLGLSPLDLPVGLGCFVLAYPFIELMNMLGVWIYSQTQDAMPDGMAHPTLVKLENDSGNPWVWAIVGAAVIGAPFVEELVYRVFLQGALIKWLKSPWLAIIISSLVFAGMHRMGGENAVPWHALLPIFAVGLTCGIAYERTKRVGVPIMMHMCFNGLNVMLALMISADAPPPVV